MADDPHYFLGIDGGGTGCRARLVDQDGRVLGTGNAGPASLRLGAETAWTALMGAAAAALGEAELDTTDSGIHVVAGVAGTSLKNTLQTLISKPHAFASLCVVSDAAIACLGAHGGKDGGVVIAGTGSIGFGTIGEREIRVGGHGFPISDAGSGADIGLAAIRLAVCAHDGLRKRTPLLTEIMTGFGNDPSQILDWLDHATPGDYAAFVPQVAKHCAAGDVAARSLLENAAADIAALANALTAQGIPRLALMGSLAPVLLPFLPSHLQQRLVAPEADALAGALILAQRMAARSSGA